MIWFGFCAIGCWWLLHKWHLDCVCLPLHVSGRKGGAGVVCSQVECCKWRYGLSPRCILTGCSENKTEELRQVAFLKSNFSPFKYHGIFCWASLPVDKYPCSCIIKYFYIISLKRSWNAAHKFLILNQTVWVGLIFFLLLVKPDVSGSVNVESEASEVQIGRCVRALRIYTCCAGLGGCCPSWAVSGVSQDNWNDFVVFGSTRRTACAGTCCTSLCF